MGLPSGWRCSNKARQRIDVLRAAHGSGGIGWDDLADHKPVEQVAKHRKPLLDTRRGELARLHLDPGGDVQGSYVRGMPTSQRPTPKPR
jgi:hypothetical protein